MLMVLFAALPTLQGLHLLVDGRLHPQHVARATDACVAVTDADHHSTATSSEHPGASHSDHDWPAGHDDRHCSVCVTISQVGLDAIRLDLLAVLHGETPHRFVAPDYLPPTQLAFERHPSIPRGPPAAV